ncbi:hypothetical protein [Paraburkholderia humisilvae]|uniref:Uncharacterized protein n=1 Tax=Paraburkholderia humisilvae TaxID=627669 RepID=A0A6J5DN48_9BURK|nr:hypothetical protein [Paraburkholderia humisilvae]CAB3754944.1 hypothetical protein LMG29542_02498 [Paraburkholderia humisilvae]
MTDDNLTDAERKLFDSLPRPPVMATVQTTSLWIIEWLSSDELQTGRCLHDWLEDPSIPTSRPGWAAYVLCKSKAEVIAAIDRAISYAEQTGMKPVLHLEAHGDTDGLAGPDSNGGTELLRWDELTSPLQRLNVATNCNLVVVVAACIGFAAIQAFYRGPRAPAVALVGPDREVAPSNLLWATKEFYRRWMDRNANLGEITKGASREVAPVVFESEPFAILAYEAMMKPLIISMRPEEQRLRVERMRYQMRVANTLSGVELERRLALLPPLPPPAELQRAWDEMFMIDLHPENRERFGIDMGVIVDLISST